MSKTTDRNKERAWHRTEILKKSIGEYLQARLQIETGFDRQELIASQKHKILNLLGGTERDWDDWRWQVKNRISDVELLAEILQMNQADCEKLKKIGEKYRWSISPFFLSLINPDDKLDPIKLQAIPSQMEMRGGGNPDPMKEEETSPAPCITRRYPDRLIIKITNQCAMYCRHCQRRRAIGEVDHPESKENLEAAIQYVAENEEVRDILLTGGDAFLLSTKRIEWIVKSLRAIKHVEIIRLGSRSLITLPQRVDQELVDALSKYHPLYVNTQFNHPLEITPEAKKACDLLSSGGIPLGNQMVLLQGINNNPHLVKKMNQELLKLRVRPYYIFHAKAVEGTTHFQTRIDDGMEIMEYLRGQTSGMAIPTFIINAPGGYGKTPVLPEYIISWGRDKIKMRTWEGRVLDYTNRAGPWHEADFF